MGYKKLGLTFNIALISTSSALYNLGFVIGTALLILYLVNLGYSPFLAGALLTFSRLLYSIAMMTTGSLSDRIGRKRPMIWGFALTALAMLAMSIMMNQSAVAILVVFIWLGFSFQSPAASAVVSEMALLGKTAIAFGWYYTSISVAKVLGQIIVGVTVQNYGYSNTLLLAGATAIGSMTLIFRYKERHHNENASLNFYEDLKHGVRIIRSERRLQYLSIALSVHAMGFFMSYTFIPLVAEVDQGLSKTAIGILLALFSVGSALALLPFAVITNKIGGLNMLTWHLALSSMTWWIYPLLNSYGIIILLMTTLGIIGAMDMPARRELMSYVSEKELGTAMGALDAISMTIGSLGALMAGALWEIGHWVPFVASVFINATGILFLLKLRR